MSKAKTLAGTVSTGGVLADGTVSAAELSGLGTGVATALAVNVGAAGAPVVNGGALGTPSSGTLSNATGLPIATGVSGLGTGVAAALAVSVGSAGASVVSGGALGTPSSGTATNLTGLPLSTGVTGTLPVANGGTGQTSLSAVSVGTATNLAGGSNGTIPYQSAEGTTQMLAVGTAGQVLTSNGAAAPTWAAPPASAGTVTAVASGSLSDGTPVVVNSNGTVSAITQTIGTTPTFGSYSQFNSGSTSYISGCYEPVSGRVFVAYSDDANSGYGTCVVGTVSGSTITFGTPIVFRAGYALFVNIIALGSTGYVSIAWRDNALSAIGRIVFGSWTSGNSASFANYYTFESAQSYPLSMAYASHNQTLAIFYLTSPNLAAYVQTTQTSGGAISGFGSGIVFPSGSITPVNGICSAYDSGQQKIALFYRDQNNNYGYGVAVTVNGISNAATFGTPVNFSTNLPSAYTSCVYTTASKTALVFVDGNNNNYLTGVIATMSGSTISFGTSGAVGSVTVSYPSITYDTAYQKLFVFYQRNGSATDTSASIGSISGTTISWGAVTQMLSAQDVYTSAFYDVASGKAVVAYAYPSASQAGRAIAATVSSSTNLTAQNFIGFSNAAYSNGATATIQTVGSVDDAQSGLTAASTYYVQPNGTIALTAGSPSVVAGTAISATKIIVKG